MKNLFLLLALILTSKLSFAADLDSNCISLREFANLVSIRISMTQTKVTEQKIFLKGYIDIFPGRNCSWDIEELGRAWFDIEVFRLEKRVKFNKVRLKRLNEEDPEFEMVNKLLDTALGMIKNIELVYEGEKILIQNGVIKEAIIGRNNYQLKFDEYE